MTPRRAAAPLFSGAADRGGLAGELAYASIATALAVAIGAGLERWLGFDDLSLVFITAVIFVAVRTRMAVAVYAAALCFLAYNYFFIHPRYTFYISAQQGVTTVALFLVAALICGRLANRLRSQLLLLRAASAQADALQRLGRRLTAATDEAEALRAADQALRDALHAEVAILLADEASGQLQEAADERTAARYDPALRVSALRCWAQMRSDAGSSASAASDDVWHCLPLALHGRRLGVVCLRFSSPLPQLAGELARLAETMTRDLAQALARARLVRQLETARLQGETERLRAALLSSVSHDLRSPLSTIIGSAESLDAYHDRLSPADRQALTHDILSEGQRLDRYIQNLLDMTRLGHGSLAIEREWVGLDEICGAVLPRLKKLYPAIDVQLRLPGDLPLLHVHPALIEQALFNVLENAAKFSPGGEPVLLSAERDGDRLHVDVADRGPGIPEAERQRIFDMFYSVERGDRDDRAKPGTGLGLTICQGMIAAHGGSVAALAGRDGRGTTIRLTLPQMQPPQERPRDE